MTSLLAFFAEIDWNDVAQAALDTLTMLAWSLGWTVLLGLPLGIVLYLTGEAAFAVRPAPLPPAVIVRQRTAIPAVHHFAHRDDPGDHVADRHLAGGGRNHSAAGRRLRPVLRPAGGNRPARSGARPGGGQLVDGRQHLAAYLAHAAAGVAGRADRRRDRDGHFAGRLHLDGGG